MWQGEVRYRRSCGKLGTNYMCLAHDLKMALSLWVRVN